MAYGQDAANNLLFRFLPVAVIQFGMAGLGMSVVMIKNKESFTQYGLIKKNIWPSVISCLCAAIPTVLFLYFTDDINGFMPFQGMFLTDDILGAPFPFNILGYLIIAIIWGFFEEANYVVLSDKINQLKKPGKWFNLGAFICAILCILIHGMIGTSMTVVAEAAAAFVLIYGSLAIKEKTGNAWGNILIFFVIWNAL